LIFAYFYDIFLKFAYSVKIKIYHLAQFLVSISWHHRKNVEKCVSDPCPIPHAKNRGPKASKYVAIIDFGVFLVDFHQICIFCQNQNFSLSSIFGEHKLTPQKKNVEKCVPDPCPMLHAKNRGPKAFTCVAIGSFVRNFVHKEIYIYSQKYIQIVRLIISIYIYIYIYTSIPRLLRYTVYIIYILFLY
jgi:hypothetical protein